MSSKKVCIWLEPDLYEFCDEARGEELSVPQYIRLILKQKKKSSTKRKKVVSVPMDEYGFSTITPDLIPNDLKDCADLIEEWWPIRKQKGAINSTKVAERIFKKLRTFTPKDRKIALEKAIAGGWKDIYEIKESKFAKDEQVAPKPRYFKASENPMPPTLKELGLDKAMNGEKQ